MIKSSNSNFEYCGIKKDLLHVYIYYYTKRNHNSTIFFKISFKIHQSKA